jgi:hypothetical protein
MLMKRKGYAFRITTKRVVKCSKIFKVRFLSAIATDWAFGASFHFYSLKRHLFPI